MKKIVIRHGGTVLKTDNPDIAQVVLIKLSNEQEQADVPVAVFTHNPKSKILEEDSVLAKKEEQKKASRKKARDKYVAKKKAAKESEEASEEAKVEKPRTAPTFMIWTDEEDDVLLNNLDIVPDTVAKMPELSRHTYAAILTRLSSIRNLDKKRLRPVLYEKVKNFIESKYKVVEEEVKDEQIETNDTPEQN